VTPILFGDPVAPLFGALHEPPADVERGHGVLVCPPIAQEHVRTHWALRQLAVALARAGFHVLRFDWYGVGDSAGRSGEGGVARWVDDARAAAQELRDATGLRKISVVGLRFGATLAALAGRRLKPQALVLWDPVLDGPRYLRELGELHAKVVADQKRFFYKWPALVRARLGHLSPALAQARTSGPDEMVGFPFGPALRAEIGAVGREALCDLSGLRVALVESDPDPERGPFVERLRERGARPERQTTAARGHWQSPDEIEELFLPADALQAVVAALEAKS
jgi:uncharacterized protein